MLNAPPLERKTDAKGVTVVHLMVIVQQILPRKGVYFIANIHEKGLESYSMISAFRGVFGGSIKKFQNLTQIFLVPYLSHTL